MLFVELRFIIFSLLGLLFVSVSFAGNDLNSYADLATLERSTDYAVIQSSTCQNPSGYTCDFYRQCLNRTQPCGQTGYAIGYGEKYCQKFLSIHQELSPKGQSFAHQTRKCLMQKLVPRMNFLYATSRAASCQSTQSYAFRTHSDCYLNHVDSICELSPFGDLTLILSQFELSDMADMDSFREMRIVALTCLARLSHLQEKPTQRYSLKINSLRTQIWSNFLIKIEDQHSSERR